VRDHAGASRPAVVRDHDCSQPVVAPLAGRDDAAGRGRHRVGMLPVRAVVAHHEPLLRGDRRTLLEREADLVGEVASGEALESRVSELEPDVVVVDVALPGRCDAFTATRRIVAARAEVGACSASRARRPAAPRAADGRRRRPRAGCAPARAAARRPQPRRGGSARFAPQR
jgi:CheY-like chemotaxis protein